MVGAADLDRGRGVDGRDDMDEEDTDFVRGMVDLRMLGVSPLGDVIVVVSRIFVADAICINFISQRR